MRPSVHATTIPPTILFALLIALSATFALAGPGLADPLWCTDADALRLGVDAATGALRLTHAGALDNCCPEPVVYDVVVNAAVVTVIERTLEASPCDCVCCFDFEATVTGLPPGAWTVVLRWLDTEAGAWRELSGQVEIPPPGGGGEPRADPAGEALCEPAVGSEPPVKAGTWGAIKAHYR